MQRFILLLMTALFLGCIGKPFQRVDERQNINQQDHCFSTEEQKLYRLINDYRKKNNLPPVPLSASLTKVARAHVEDLQKNKPDARENCNMHSWSDQGNWSSCCYTRDHKEAACMWNKPGELTDYKGNGYEIAYGTSDPASTGFEATAEKALAAWQGSPGHNAVILNKGNWKPEWNAIGIGIYKAYAVVWFGREKDPDKTEVKFCE